MEIRNIAIIAHVDHGKTTLTNALMRQTGAAEGEVTMDSNALEKERGITIYSKNTSIYYKGTKINIVDTPGHADFGSEVERVLRSIDSVVLVVDAQEGPMPQTKFVLKKSLELGLKPIVVINKIDKLAAMPSAVHEMIFDLFLNLGATDEQLDFPTIYAIGREGIAQTSLDENSKDLSPLLDAILANVPSTASESDQRPLLLQPFNLGYDNFLGRLAIARMYAGNIHVGDSVIIKNEKKPARKGKITKIFTFEGLNRKEVEKAVAGDIIMIAGIPDVDIGETVCLLENQPALPAIAIDEPTISLNFFVNNSPFAGREGKYVSSQHIKERLKKELEVNVGLKINFISSDVYNVCGRGELHIAILLENIRREGYELQISRPHVIIKEENGARYEPFEEVTIIVPEKMSGTIIEKLSKRKGSLTEMKEDRGNIKMIFEIPTRGLLGYKNEFVIDTRGEGIIYTRLIGFQPAVGVLERSETGSMISMSSGKALAFSLWNLQERGAIYITPGTEVYEGMVIGAVSKGNDLTVNPIKGKQLTNMRASGSDEGIHLTPPMELTLEKGMNIMHDDEYLEITPKSVRLRKKYLTENERVRARRGKNL